VNGRNKLPTQVEQVVYSGVGVKKPLRLMSGLESPHATLSDSCRLMRELRSIVCVLGGVVGRIRGDIAMSDSVTTQLIGNDSSELAIAYPEQALEEANGCLSISATL